MCMCTNVMACVLRPENNWEESLLSYHVGPVGPMGPT